MMRLFLSVLCFSISFFISKGSYFKILCAGNDVSVLTQVHRFLFFFYFRFLRERVRGLT